MRYLKAAALTATVLVVVGAVGIAANSRGWLDFLKGSASGAATGG